MINGLPVPHQIMLLEKPSRKHYRNIRLLLVKKSIEIIKSLSPGDLQSELEPSPVSHPIAKNKFEALDWNIKHTMWHCGQLGVLRVVHERYDFGLKKSERQA